MLLSLAVLPLVAATLLVTAGVAQAQDSGLSEQQRLFQRMRVCSLTLC